MLELWNETIPYMDSLLHNAAQIVAIGEPLGVGNTSHTANYMESTVFSGVAHFDEATNVNWRESDIQQFASELCAPLRFQIQQAVAQYP